MYKNIDLKSIIEWSFVFLFAFWQRKQKKLLPVENIKQVYDDQIASINSILNPNALNWN